MYIVVSGGNVFILEDTDDNGSLNVKCSRFIIGRFNESFKKKKKSCLNVPIVVYIVIFKHHQALVDNCWLYVTVVMQFANF